jgi:putative transposase
MARQSRAVFGGLPHLVALRVQHQQTLAVDDADRAAAVHLLSEGMRSADVLIHAYGIDDQRVELVVTPPSAEALSRAMQSFARRHAAAFNRRHARHGSLWAGRFEAAVLESESWLWRAMLRVEQSPEGGWRALSSAAHHCGLVADARISEPTAYWTLGNTPFERDQRYRAALAEPLPPAWRSSMDAALRGGWPLGSAAFIAGLSERSSRTLMRRLPGRPRSGLRKSG